MKLDLYGPQRPAEPKLLRRVRAHQSWYRVEVLGFSEWGVTAPPSESEMGSVLTASDAKSGANFESPAALEAYRKRRRQGWGVEPYRCERYMTSSQTMTFNVFAPVAAAPAWLMRSLDVLGYGRPVGDFRIEYRPSLRRRKWLDKTVIDAFVPTSKGGLVVETKLADQFSKRGTTRMAGDFYEQLNGETGLWRTATEFEAGAADQLARVHGAGSAVAGRAADLLVVHHGLDTATPRKMEAYRELLTNPARLRALPLDAVLDVLQDTASNAGQRETVEKLRTRYTDMPLSRSIFEELEANRPRSTSKARIQ